MRLLCTLSEFTNTSLRLLRVVERRHGTTEVSMISKDTFWITSDQLEIQRYHKSDQLKRGMSSFAIQPI